MRNIFVGINESKNLEELKTTVNKLTDRYLIPENSLDNIKLVLEQIIDKALDTAFVLGVEAIE